MSDWTMFFLCYVVGSYALTWALCLVFVHFESKEYQMERDLALVFLLLAPVTWFIPATVLFVLMPGEWLYNRGGDWLASRLFLDWED